MYYFIERYIIYDLWIVYDLVGVDDKFSFEYVKIVAFLRVFKELYLVSIWIMRGVEVRDKIF